MRYVIYCDMDGTLTDFEGLSYKLFGEKFEPANPKVPLAKKIEVVQSIRTFWSHMPWMSDGRILWNHIQHHDVHILSAYALWDYHNCLNGKLSWLRRNTATVPNQKIHLVHRNEKRTFAKPTAPDTLHILIDDYHKNTSEWTAAGGHAIFHTSAVSTIASLRKLGL